MGTYDAAVCGDGISVASFESLSAEKSGKSIDAWRSAVVSALQEAKQGDMAIGKATLSEEQASEFHNVAKALSGETKGVAKWSSPDELESLLDGKVPELSDYAGNGAGYREHKRPMWNYLKRKGLAYEADWQRETSASWVDAKGKVTYADAATEPYFVASSKDEIPLGSFAKITANGKTIYARMMEGGPALGEISIGAWKGLGYTSVTPNAAPTDKVTIEVLNDSGGMSSSFEKGHLSYDEIQRAGKLIEDGKVKSIKTRDDLLKAEGKSDEPKKTASIRLERGFKTVAIGSNMRRVGYASADCTHDGGGYVKEGSATVFVGPHPFSRIGDGTSDDLGILTGDDSVFVGGATKAIA
jgi:hypothetical protein